MNWDVPYVVSRSLVLQIGAGGELLAGNSVSRMREIMLVSELRTAARAQNLHVDLV